MHKNFAFDFDSESSTLPTAQSSPEVHKNAVKIMKHKEIQTEVVISNESTSNLNDDVIRNEIATKDKVIQQLKSKVTESEMSLSLFRNQLGDKQSQITFYEKHILELQSKLEGMPKVGESTTENGDEIMALKVCFPSFVTKCYYHFINALTFKVKFLIKCLKFFDISISDLIKRNFFSVFFFDEILKCL